MTDAEINSECARRLGAIWVRLIDREPHRSLVMPDDDTGALPRADMSEAIVQIHAIPNFHGSVDAAMGLVSKAREWGYDLLLDNSANMWTAKFWDCQREIDTYIEFVGESKDLASAAICAAFLQLPQPTETP